MDGMSAEPIRFRCRCGRTVVTIDGSLADEQRTCTRCRIRSLRTTGVPSRRPGTGSARLVDADLVRHDAAEPTIRRAAG